MDTRKAFHELIDRIENEESLIGYFQLINALNDTQTGILWESLTPGQKRELLVSYEESFDPKNLVSHDEVRKSLSKWLEK